MNGSTTGVTVTILFGSLFATGGLAVPAMIAIGVLVLVVVLAMYRPLLLSSVSADLAAARGIPVRLVGLLFLMLMGLAVALSSVGVGTILSPALLIGPAAVALRMTRRPPAAMILAGMIGTACTWAGVCSPTTATTGHRSAGAGR
jgi:zinc/manganese transport system permease protein